MTNTVQLKRSNVANSVPSAGNLVPGELAINYTDGNLFYKNSSNIVTVIASNQFVSVTGNVTGNYFLGNANIQYTASTAPATGNLIGAQWYDTSTDTLYEWQTDGTSTYWVDITGPVIGSTGVATGSIIVNGTSNVTIPTANGNARINIGGTANVAVFATTGEYVTGIVSATGNITGGNITTAGNVTGNYILGNGSQLTGIAATQLSGSMVGNITGANTYSINNLQDLTLNPTGSNITIGSIQASNFNNRWYFNTDMDVNGRLSAAGNVLGSNVIASGYISSTGNITGNNFSAGGAVSVTGNVTGGNIATSSILSVGGNANIAGNINMPTADANLTFGAVSVRNFNNRFYVNTDTDINGRLSAVGNVIGGNILTGGLVSATGNITGGNLNATGLSLSGNVVSAINTTANITTTANISGGNLLTGGLISSTGNITGGNILGGSNVNATTHTGTTVSVSANVTGGNLLTSGLISATGNISANNATFTSGLGVGTTITPGSGIILDVLGGEIKASRVDSNSEGGQISFGRATDNATAWYLDVYGNTSTPSLRFIDVSTGAVSMSINSSGAVALRGAVSATGVGITFPATQSASSNANTLDDYEEGTWTPVLQFDANTQTTTTPIATYVKVGKSVTINMQIAWAAKSGSGRVYITGLPFAREAGGTVPLLAGCPAGSVTTGAAIFYNVDGGGTVLNLAEQAGDINSASLAASGSLFCSGTYFV